MRIASMAHYTQHDNTNWGEQAAQWVEILYSILRPLVRIILKNMLIVIKKKYKNIYLCILNYDVSIQQYIYLNFMPCLMRSKKYELISVAKTDQLAIKKPPFENTTLYIDMAISSDSMNEKPSLIMSYCLSLLLTSKIIIN